MCVAAAAPVTTAAGTGQRRRTDPSLRRLGQQQLIHGAFASLLVPSPSSMAADSMQVSGSKGRRPHTAPAPRRVVYPVPWINSTMQPEPATFFLLFFYVLRASMLVHGWMHLYEHHRVILSLEHYLDNN
uniref:Uncharacterized protein n=1 Tax=Triticum urartu TaxID=4572 RepID=A0A8R7UK48_TRIUA